MSRVAGRRPARARAILVACVVVAACGAAVTPAPSITSEPTATVAATPTPSAAPTEPAAGSVVVDAALLEVLPAQVDGLPLVENPEGEAGAMAAPGLADFASGIVAGLAIDSASGEFVYAVVVRVRVGAMSAPRYQAWRDSFDTAACAPAGGVSGHATTQIAGRSVYVATCAGGVVTYHVWLQARRILVSVSALGERRLGERLLDGLRP